MSNRDPSFKECPLCKFVWRSREDFLADSQVYIGGYMPNFERLVAGLLLFNHDTPDCGTTMAITAEAFADLYNGPMFAARLHGTKECPGHCLYQNDLRPCPEKCECAFVREVLQIVKNWPKRA